MKIDQIKQEKECLLLQTEKMREMGHGWTHSLRLKMIQYELIVKNYLWVVCYFGDYMKKKRMTY